MKETFMEGGWFTVAIGETLKVIATDSLYWDNENEQVDRQIRVNQMTWLNEQLNTATDNMKFILTEHIYETGAFNAITNVENDGFEGNWYEDSLLEQYYRTMYMHKDKVAFKITGHDHLSDFRVHSSNSFYSGASDCKVTLPFAEDPFLGKMITPSFTA